MLSVWPMGRGWVGGCPSSPPTALVWGVGCVLFSGRGAGSLDVVRRCNAAVVFPFHIHPLFAAVSIARHSRGCHKEAHLFFLLWHPLSDVWWLSTNRHRLPTNRHRLPTNRHRLPTNRHRLPTNRHRLPTNRHRLHTNRHRLPTNRHRLHTKRHRLPTNRHRLHTNRHRLPTNHHRPHQPPSVTHQPPSVTHRPPS